MDQTLALPVSSIRGPGLNMRSPGHVPYLFFEPHPGRYLASETQLPFQSTGRVRFAEESSV